MKLFISPVKARNCRHKQANANYWEAFLTALRAPGKNLKEARTPERLNGTNTKPGKGCGADEKRESGNL